VEPAQFAANPDCAIGCTLWAILKVKNSEQYGDSNEIKRIIKPTS
jgi:hypothetical protein